MLAFLVLSYLTQAYIRRSQYVWYERDVEDPCPWVVLWNSSQVSTFLRSLMLLTAVWRRVHVTVGEASHYHQRSHPLPKLLTKMKYEMFSSSFKVII